VVLATPGGAARLGALLSWTMTFSRETRRERAFTMQQMVLGKDLYDVDLYGKPPEEGLPGG
jgi:hypothetical protein